jgi:predicted metal-binding membrane protein
MMLPLMLGAVRHVASSGRGLGRHRAIAEFAAGYLTVWMAAMLLITRTWSTAAALLGSTVVVGIVIAAAALWEVAPAKQGQLRRCARKVPIAESGWRADADCARFGAVAGAACVASCWALMAVCVAFAHSLPVMIALFGVQLGGRYQQRPSPVLSAAAIVGVCVASLAARFAG